MRFFGILGKIVVIWMIGSVLAGCVAIVLFFVGLSDTSTEYDGDFGKGEIHHSDNYEYVDLDGKDEAVIYQYTGNSEHVEIPSEIDGQKVIGIEANAFYRATSIFNDYEYSAKSVVIPESVTLIDEAAFSGCYKLESIEVAEGNKNYISSDGNLYTKDAKTLVRYAPSRSGKHYTVQSDTEEIRPLAFEDCQNLLLLTIPESVKVIEGGTLLNVGVLCKIINNSSVIMHIPEAGSYYKDKYYNEDFCKILESKNGVKIYAQNYIEVGDGFVFEKRSDTMLLVVYLGDEETVRLPESCNGESYSIGRAIGFKNVMIPGSFAEVSASTFSNSDGLESVIVEEGITRIGSFAFSECDDLESIVLPSTLQEIKGKAFEIPTYPDGPVAAHNIYYSGTAEMWNNVVVELSSEKVFENLHYYSEGAPTESGKYWHYDEEGRIVVWEQR